MRLGGPSRERLVVEAKAVVQDCARPFGDGHPDSFAPQHSVMQAAVTNASLSRLSHPIKRLEARGLVRRESGSADGRFTNAILTAKGYKKLVVSAPGHVETMRDLVIDEFSADELRQLRDLSERMVGRINSHPDLSGD